MRRSTTVCRGTRPCLLARVEDRAWRVIGSVAYNATATRGVAALIRPLTVNGILAPAVAAAVLPLALLAAAPRGRLGRAGGAVLVVGYAVWVTVVLRR